MRNRTLISFGFLVLAAVARPGLAEAAAEPLTLYQLDALAEHLHCMNECGSDTTCRQACPSWSTKWDKDLSGLVGNEDMDLGLMEYWDDLRERYVCYQKSDVQVEPSTCLNDCVVTPHSLCGAALCIDEKSEAECKDVDGDGLRAWQEGDLGTSDYDHNADCSGTEQVCTFTQKCETDIDVAGLTNASRCTNRDDCDEGGCTAFHLERVSVNNNELIIRVWYDYSPKPARVLDLYIDYDDTALHLIDARPLKLLTDAGKQLAASHPQSDVLRLVVLDSGSNTAIPTGAIVELVFDRISSAQSTVEFTEEDHLQEMSMAPDQGTDGNGELIREQLGDDSLWGEDIQIPAADPNGPRLLLYYSFDNPNDYMNYADVKNGAELCEQVSECSVFDTAIPVQKEERDKLTARLSNLQKGAESITETIDAVIGPGAYLNGKTDHLEFPLTMNDPTPSSDGTLYFDRTPQGFSLSTWFYAEGDDSLGITEEGQVLFSRNTNNERTRFGVLIQKSDQAGHCAGIDDDDDGETDEAGEEGPTVKLVWFQDEIHLSMHQVVIADDICARKWTHLGVVLTDTLPEVDDDDDGLTDDADDDEFDRVNFYIDGVLREFELDGPPNVTAMPFRGIGGYNYGDGYEMQCPYPQPAGGLGVHEEGDLSVAANPGSPEVLFFASAENNLFGIEQMDLNGFARKKIIRDGLTSAKDPDYHPTLDKIVYASSNSGNYEIWIADGDGSNARQITKGFGDTARKIFARRPTWAPDGSAIVFDSNVYSIEHLDNWYKRVYHLYYIEYNPQTNEVAIPQQAGGTLTELEYDYVASSQIIEDYRLTGGYINHMGAVWRTGKPSDGSHRGEIWYNTSTDKYEDREIRTLQIPSLIGPKTGSAVNLDGCSFAPSGDGDASTDEEVCNPTKVETTILDAYYINLAGQGEQSEMLFKREWGTYEAASHFTMTTTEQEDVEHPRTRELRTKITVNLFYTPDDNDFAEGCWDLNNNYPETECDEDTEDRNDDKVCDKKDCYAYEIPNLYLKYHMDDLVSDVGLSGPSPNDDIIDPSGLDKEVEIGDNYTSCGQYVKVRVMSPVNNKLIPAGTPLASVVFWLKPDTPTETHTFEEADDLDLEQRHTHQEIGIYDLVNYNVARFVVADDFLEFVLGGEFSPDGNRVAISGIQNARPVLVVSQNDAGDGYRNFNTFNPITNSYDLDVRDCEVGPVKFSKISILPMNVEGLDWVPVEQFYPCTWFGGYLNPDSRLFGHAFRGGIDELKLYSYPREAGAFQSDAERGAAWLDKEGLDGLLDEKEQPCTSDLECPPYMLCDNETGGTFGCYIEACHPEDDPCDTGACTLMPVPVGLGEDMSYEWVCSVECATDKQCFTQECLNGPCRFCDTQGGTASCFECRETEQNINGIELSYIEGCPDRNSFDCQDGSCVTDCYAFENGESKFLCDPALEYCSQGSCKIFDWEWYDLAPASLIGLGETAYDQPELHISTAVDQLWPVQIKAYGVEDYLHPPELLIEGQSGIDGADPYGGEWFKLGQVVVYNKNATEAEQNLYVVFTPFAIKKLRIRLVTPEYHNLNSAASGLDEDSALCDDNDCLTCLRWEARPDTDGCTRKVCLNWSSADGCDRRASGSRANLGYRIGIPLHESRKACAERGLANCNHPAVDYLRPYLPGGQPAVAILDVFVDGSSAKVGPGDYANICPYYDYDESVGNVVVGTHKPQWVDPNLNMLIDQKVIFGDAIKERSNQKTKFYPNAKDHTAPIDTRKLADGPGKSWYLLNCNLADETDKAYLQYTVCASDQECNILFRTMGVRKGPILEDATGCIVERGMRSTPCYEWTGADVSLDYMSYMAGAAEPWHTLDFDYYRSFGYDE